MADAGLVLAIFVLIIYLVGIIWVWFDASVNSSQSTLLWVLVVFFGGILGILLYILLGRDGGDSDEYTAESNDLPPQYR